MKPSWVSVITSVFAFVSGFVITSAYRSYIKRKNWTQLNPAQLVLPIIGSTIIISILWTAAFLSFHNAVRQLFNLSSEFHIEAALEQAVNTTTIIFLWNLLYFSIYFIQLGQRSRIEKYKMEAEARKAQLNMLRSQINPHFMFNALNNIRALTLEDVPRSREMITHLSDLLRYSMTYSKKQEVSLREELGIVEQFLQLCEIQFEERLRYQIKSDENCLNLMVPPMTIQLLVENSVKHGIAKLKNGGEVKINCSLEEGVLHLKVRNSGELNPVNNPIPAAAENNGIGLENIARRLQLMHGHNATFSICQIDEWVEAEITIKQRT